MEIEKAPSSIILLARRALAFNNAVVAFNDFTGNFYNSLFLPVQPTHILDNCRITPLNRFNFVIIKIGFTFLTISFLSN